VRRPDVNVEPCLGHVDADVRCCNLVLVNAGSPMQGGPGDCSGEGDATTTGDQFSVTASWPIVSQGHPVAASLDPHGESGKPQIQGVSPRRQQYALSALWAARRNWVKPGGNTSVAAAPRRAQFRKPTRPSLRRAVAGFYSRIEAICTRFDLGVPSASCYMSLRHNHVPG
jgi:hypothetical protein